MEVRRVSEFKFKGRYEYEEFMLLIFIKKFFSVMNRSF